MSHSAANLRALEGRFPELAAFLAPLPADPRLSLSPARSGAMSASLGSAAVHSRYDPEAEAARLVSAFPLDCATCVFYGFGLGYLPQAFLESHPDSIAVVVEPEPSLLKAALDSRDMEGLLRDERLSFLLGARPEAIVQALDELRADDPGRLPLKAHVDAYPDYYAACDEVLRRYAEKQHINDNTLRRFGNLWVRNLSQNLPWMGRLPGIRSILGAFKGMPALVVAAGPSLDEALPRLKRLARGHLVVAVDTAASAVQRSGVDPDFCVVVDPQYWNTRHLDGFDGSRSILITESAVHPAVLRRPWRAVFLCSSIFPLGRFMEERLGDMGTLGAGGSVATSAWDFSRLMGCSPVTICGMDLGFPGRATHARDSFFERRALMRAHRLKPVELDSFLAFRSADPYLAPDNSGGSVFTDRRMALYAWWFESRLARADAAPSLSLSRKGLAIPGLPCARLEDSLGAQDIRARLDAILSAVADMKPHNGQPFGVAFDALVSSLESLGRESGRALAVCDKAGMRLKRGEGASGELAELGDIDARLLGNPAKEIVSFLFPDIHALMRSKPESLEEALANSAKIYLEARRQAEYHVGILTRKGLKR